MSFHEVRLNEEVERGASGGPRFSTTVRSLVSGHEKRNINWSETRGRWDIGFGIQTLELLREVIDFFYARRGKAHGFRFKDWSDYQVMDETTVATADGVETTFDLFKRYSSGGVDFDRRVYKLVSGTITIFEDGMESTSPLTILHNTGQVQFNDPPAGGTLIGWTGEFDVPVRFDTDELNISVETFEAGAIPQIPIVELRQS